MEIRELQQYFSGLTDRQVALLEALPPLYTDWNAKVNLISRKDMEHFTERHILHSLSVAFYFQPAAGAKILDIGTGGGFPGIPLAILFPEVSFLLVDSIGKKIKVVNEIASELGLANVEAVQKRAEEVKGSYHFVVSRAVARLSALVGWCTVPGLKIGGIYCLKGGDLTDEIEEIDRYPSTVYKLESKLPQPFFETKKVVYVKLR